MLLGIAGTEAIISKNTQRMEEEKLKKWYFYFQYIRKRR
jgi:hypothetical protein